MAVLDVAMITVTTRGTRRLSDFGKARHRASVKVATKRHCLSARIDSLFGREELRSDQGYMIDSRQQQLVDNLDPPIITQPDGSHHLRQGLLTRRRLSYHWEVFRYYSERIEGRTLRLRAV